MIDLPLPPLETLRRGVGGCVPLALIWHMLRVLRNRPSRRHEPVPSTPDPFELVAGDLSGLSDGIKALIGTDHPVLNAAAKYFFELDGGKKMRPTMVS